jgi:hypothetical protein
LRCAYPLQLLHLDSHDADPRPRSLHSAAHPFPNAAAHALAPFHKNIGGAAALLGFLQMGIGALASTGASSGRRSPLTPSRAALH